MLTVGTLMTRKLVTVPPECPLERARALFDEHRLRHLPVVERGRLVGIVSERDLVERTRSPARSGQPEGPPAIRERMNVSVETVTSDESASKACRRMLERRISCLPVVREGRVIGVLTELDLMRLYERVCRFAGHDPALDPPIERRASGAMVVISPDATVLEALDLCRAKGIRHLPVVLDGWVEGMVSDRDLLPVVGRSEGEHRRVDEVMTRDFVAVVPGTRMSAAAECMLANGFHSLPVLVEGALQGIVTSADVLAALCAIDEQALESAWSGESALSASAEES